MLATTKTLITRALGTAAIIGAAGFTVLACAQAQDHSGTSSSTASDSTTSATSTSSSTARPSTSTDANGIPIEPGPNLPPATSIPADRVVPDVPGTKCGATQGPDGALELVILKGSIKCDTAKKVAAEYGPKIATGQQQMIQGWTCGPSNGENILAACAKDSNAFVFQLPN
ncbi:hypothetical protein [Gordonia sp. (in: high G+C Gram-positive bacteria)]|uniref:hypothetical protein n=1 Tax=Gordonia sp. (in: high G+C Gram-positive bacteria) TaxID=84139 RepID=UPI0039E723FE